MNPDVIVVGGGLVGCATAYFLARERISVVLLEKDARGGETSRAAAGMLAPCAESDGTGSLLRFGLECLDEFPSLVAELRERSGVDPQYERSGILRVALSDRDAETLRQRGRTLERFGVEWLDPADTGTPKGLAALCGRGALWSPREGHVESALLLGAFARAAESLGVRIERGVVVGGLVRQGSSIAGVRTLRGDRACGHVVLATGSWGSDAEGWLNLPGTLPVMPVRGQIVALEAPSSGFDTILWGPEVYLVPKRDGRLLVGATEEHVGFDCRVTEKGLQGLLGAATRWMPGLAHTTVRGVRAGLRPDSADHLPLLGPVPDFEGLTLALGHYRNGVLLSGGTGRLVTDRLLGKPLPDYTDGFRPDRFFSPAAGRGGVERRHAESDASDSTG